ncbi:hypothetical protein SEVIR_9G506300v4 [Setaria viridis]|uniref:Uncharacterized protein n=1 Tax=Setaria viridis TaxID=4556 RepID=A0A4U6TAR0_SETVI|nr:uncharacterized protein LOC117835528 [Setaria viridis]TKV97618.1 hypothetical protein SEVIR_9G506300v2 [Setaria viridis]TKV97619.1 hypothetical protein SEVIR_9G506300v2 [Setaria viridis]
MVGGSIRAAAKAAMIGGYRSAAYMRRAVIPSSNSSSSSSAADNRKASTLVADDWVIPDREVFGPVPTHEEAMAATLDLSEAFEIAKAESHTADLDTPKKHFSITDQDNHAKVAQQIALPQSVESETPQVVVHSETSKKEDNYENLLAASGTPGRVVQAFTLLHENPEAQDVVASLASDKNVWDAVMKNEKVLKFYKTYESKLSQCSSAASSVSGDEAEDGDAASVQSTDLRPSTGESVKDYLEKMRALVFEMVTNLSNMMQDLVATPDEGRCKGKIKTLIMSSSKDFPSAPSAFVLLAIASIMVVLLKRA